jgi:tetratricopeptide (TPR) repeat protein
MYLFKTLWPIHLAYLYPLPVHVFSETLGGQMLPAIGSTLCLGVLSILAFCMARRRPYLLVGWLWFLGMLLPVIGLMQVGRQAWADRYAYLPLVGMYLALSWSLSQWIRQRPGSRPVVSAAVVAILLALLPVTWRQVSVWHDSHRLFEHAIAVTKHNYEAHTSLGAVIADSERPLDAVVHYQRALRIHPAFAQAHYGWGAALQNAGHFEEAIPHLQRALENRPEYAEAHCSLGICLLESGRAAGAIGHLREALRIKPDYAEAHNSLGNALQFTGRSQEALGHYEQAARLNPLDPEPENNWANVLHGLGSLDEAAIHYRRALEINPDYAEIHSNLGAVAMAMGRTEAAIKHFERALQLKPDLIVAQNNLRRARAMMEE